MKKTVFYLLMNVLFLAKVCSQDIVAQNDFLFKISNDFMRLSPDLNAEVLDLKDRGMITVNTDREDLILTKWTPQLEKNWELPINLEKDQTFYSLCSLGDNFGFVISSAASKEERTYNHIVYIYSIQSKEKIREIAINDVYGLYIEKNDIVYKKKTSPNTFTLTKQDITSGKLQTKEVSIDLTKYNPLYIELENSEKMIYLLKKKSTKKNLDDFEAWMEESKDPSISIITLDKNSGEYSTLEISSSNSDDYNYRAIVKDNFLYVIYYNQVRKKPYLSTIDFFKIDLNSTKVASHVTTSIPKLNGFIASSAIISGLYQFPNGNLVFSVEELYGPGADTRGKLRYLLFDKDGNWLKEGLIVKKQSGTTFRSQYNVGCFVFMKNNELYILYAENGGIKDLHSARISEDGTLTGPSLFFSNENKIDVKQYLFQSYTTLLDNGDLILVSIPPYGGPTGKIYRVKLK